MSEKSEKETKNRSLKYIAYIGKLTALLLMLTLRCLFLDSDAYPRLSWSSALLTDEGFYIHNARNLILFGTERTDDFNNMLLMPLLHVVQVAYFRCFGVGALQARTLTIAISMLVLLIFFVSVKRAFGNRIAWIALVLLGLEPVFVMYNRMALMDTPACLPLCAAFLAWTYRQRTASMSKTNLFSAFFTGFFLALAYSVRGLAIIVVIAPLSILLLEWFRKPGLLRRAQPLHEMYALIMGLSSVLAIYAVLVWWPNRVEIAHANSFYLHAQLLPHSLKTFNRNVTRAFTHPFRGIFPFLFKHSPVFVVGMVLATFLYCVKRSSYRQSTPDTSADNSRDTFAVVESANRSSVDESTIAYLFGWVIIFLLFVTVVSYSPSRYYVLFYPPLAILTALGLDNLVWGRSTLLRHEKWRRGLSFATLFIWLFSSLYWYTDWLSHLTYRQRDADRWLAEHLPANSVLIGAVAPGLCLNNRFRCITMIPKLCNDDHPVERYQAYPRYILMLDRTSYVEEEGPFEKIEHMLTGRNSQAKNPDRWREAWWEDHYPDIVDPSRQIHAFEPIMRPFFTIGVYPVPKEDEIYWKELDEVASASK